MPLHTTILRVDDDQMLRRMSLEDNDFPRECIHGTFYALWEGILRRGLLAGGPKGTRAHIHLALGERGALGGYRGCVRIVIWRCT